MIIYSLHLNITLDIGECGASHVILAGVIRRARGFASTGCLVFESHRRMTKAEWPGVGFSGISRGRSFMGKVAQYKI